MEVVRESFKKKFLRRILHNYLVWQTARNFSPCLSKAFRDAYKNLRKALIGSDGGEEPWRYCVTDTSNGERSENLFETRSR